MVKCTFTQEALDVMAERGITEEDVTKGAEAAVAAKTYIFEGDHGIFRNRDGNLTVYGVYTPGGDMAEGDVELTITSAYAHKIVFTEEGE